VLVNSSFDNFTHSGTAAQKWVKRSFLFVSFNGCINAEPGNRVEYLKEIFDDYIPSIQEKDIDKDSITPIFYQGIDNARRE
jgi:hypothetical protein